MAHSLKDQKLDYAAANVGRGDSSPHFNSRATVLGACVILCAFIVFMYAGGAWAVTLYRLLADGIVLALWLAGAWGLGSVVLLVLPVKSAEDDAPANATTVEGLSPLKAAAECNGALSFVTSVALGLGLFSLATLGLGLAGWLNRVSAFGLLGVGTVAGIATLARSRRDASGTISDAVGAWLRAPAGWAWLWLVAMPFLAAAIVAALLPPGTMWPSEPHGYDVVEYHLQIPREWYEAGKIFPLRHNAFSFFPFNVEMHYLLAMHLQGGPWSGMYLAHFMHLATVVLTVAAVYGFAFHFTASRAAATIAALAAATVPWLPQLGSVAYNEGGLLLFGTLSMGWAFDAAVRPRCRLGRFPVAGLLAGFACGSKLTAVPEVLLAVGGLAFLAIVFTRKRRVTAGPTVPPAEGTARRVFDKSTEVPAVPLLFRFAGIGAFFFAAALTFAPWLIRNVVWAGNPVFPEAASVLGQGHFSDAQVERWKQAHAPRPDQRPVTARLDAWWKDVWLNWQYGYVLLPLGIAGGITAFFYPRRLDDPGHARTLALLLISTAVLLSVVWLGFTHLQGRFFILGVPIAALLLGFMPWGRLAPVGAAVVVLAAVVGFARLHSVLAERLYESKLALVLGFEQLSDVFVPPAFTDPLASGAPVVLVGDARAFVYPGPMSRLSYRTVFDVDAGPAESSIDAWSRGAPADAWRLVDPIELRRFGETYRGIPALPPEYHDRQEPFVVAPVGGVAR